VRLLQDWRAALVLIATFGLTLVEDLTVGIVTGCAIAAMLSLLGQRVTAEDA
jgi:sulfate permease, SulP family